MLIRSRHTLITEPYNHALQKCVTICCIHTIWPIPLLVNRLPFPSLLPSLTNAYAYGFGNLQSYGVLFVNKTQRTRRWNLNLNSICVLYLLLLLFFSFLPISFWTRFQNRFQSRCERRNTPSRDFWKRRHGPLRIIIIIILYKTRICHIINCVLLPVHEFTISRFLLLICIWTLFAFN